MNLLLGVIQLGFDPLLNLGPLEVRWQTIGIAIGLLVAFGMAAGLARRRGLSMEQLMLVLVGIVPGAVVGGRIVHVLDYLGAYSANPLSAIDPRVGSLSLTGAVIGGTLSALYVIRRVGGKAEAWAAVAAVPLLVALGGGKLAQLLGGAGQGTPFDGAWATAFVGEGPWVSFVPGLPSHPSQVYEGLWLLVGIAVVLVPGSHRRDRAGSGTRLFVGAVAWFLAGRVLVGFTWRDPSSVGPLNMEQALALVILAAGGSYLWLRRGRLARQVAVTLSLALVVGCGSTTSPLKSPIATVAPTSTASPTPAPTPMTVEGVLSQMTLDQKIGQLFVISFYGDVAAETDTTQVRKNRRLIGTDNVGAAIAKYHPGGVIYFNWAGNLNSAAQIANLSNAIQAAGAAQAPAIPLLVTTDQEGGSIVRLPPPATAFAGNMAIGASGSTDLARAAGKAMGQELRALGINQVFAPVGDVNVNPANPIIGLRSFGSDPAAVSAMTAAMIHGFQDDAGEGATVKHFPGHGDTDIDSHTQLPIINHSANQWAGLDQPPFTAAIGAGVDAVMVGHLAFPALDSSGTPASLSRPIVSDVLRTQMGFTGVVITDSLQMGALRDGYGDARIPVLAMLAGDDMLLMPSSLAIAWNAVKDAVQSGEISQSRLDQSVRRILTLKMKLGLFGAAPVSATAAKVALGTTSHRASEQQVAEASVTLLANDGGVLPLRDAAADGPYLVVGSSAAPVATLASVLRDRGLTVSTFVSGTSPPDVTGYGTIIVLTLNADTDLGQQQVVSALAATGKRLITASIGRPYDQGHYRAAINICLYSQSTASLRALVRVIFGEIAPAGHLPVAILDASDPSTTLYPLGYGISY